jgi:hypothetical protein
VILSAHNAHLTQIKGEDVVGDPVLSVTGTPGAVKWQGDAQALIRDQTTEEVRGNMRILMREVLVELPSNLPYEPTANDLLIITVGADAAGVVGTGTGEALTLEVRQVDRQFWGLGRYRYVCRYQ